MKPFQEALNEGRILVFDGAMGTQLEEQGLHPGPDVNIKSPDAVVSVHSAYIRAGADVLITNTLTANRLGLERSGEADKVVEFNAAAVRICKQAAGERAWVAGDVGPTGQFLVPYGDYTEEQFFEVYSEQTEALAGAGADLIIIETMTDLNETVIAVKACKAAASIPVVACLSFDPGAGGMRTMMGNTVESCAKALDEAGADAIGTNCGGITPEQMAEVVAAMRSSTKKPLIAEPNAGLPELVEGKVRFNLSPDAFVTGALSCIEAGATLIGGCCGTTPAHITALRKAVDSLGK